MFKNQAGPFIDNNNRVVTYNCIARTYLNYRQSPASLKPTGSLCLSLGLHLPVPKTARVLISSDSNEINPINVKGLQVKFFKFYEFSLKNIKLIPSNFI